jgi:hypothetical protein
MHKANNFSLGDGADIVGSRNNNPFENNHVLLAKVRVMTTGASEFPEEPEHCAPETSG